MSRFCAHIKAIPPMSRTWAGWLSLFLLSIALVGASPVFCMATEEAPPPAQAPAPEAEDGAPEQTVYPDVINIHIQRGGQGKPAVSLYYPKLNQPVVDEALSRWATGVADAYEADVSSARSPDGESPESFGMWDLTGLFELSRPSAHVVSVTFNIYSYTGGAHGNLEIAVLNYDMRTGKRLTFSDLFKNPEKALHLMSAWAQKDLALSLGEDADEDMIREGTAPNMDNFGNLTLTPEGLRMEFQPYQTAPWVAGPQRVDMPLAELAPAGPESLIWPQAAGAKVF